LPGEQRSLLTMGSSPQVLSFADSPAAELFANQEKERGTEGDLQMVRRVASAFVVLASVSAQAAEKTSAKLEKSLRAVVEAEDLGAGKWTGLQEQHG
jgi:hypothetical protein